MKKEYANFHISIALKTAPTILSKKINPKNYSVNPFQDGYKQILRNTTSYIGCVNVKLTTSMWMERELQLQVRRSQHADDELKKLMSELREVNVNKNTLLSLLPYIDARNILQSQTRLADIDYLPYNTQSSIILSTKSTFTQLHNPILFNPITKNLNMV